MNKVNDIKKFMQEYGFVPSKKMGQNFLYNKDIQEKIISYSKIYNEDCILEIGPGLGAITKLLVKHAKKVVSIELDKRLYDYLKNNVNSDNFILYNNDILKTDINKVVKENSLTNVKVVANLPYSISSKIIIELLKIKEIKDIYILVQKEMAQRINAKVGTKDYNSFTVLLSLYFDIKNLFNVTPDNFIPRPNVDSSFIHLKRKDNNPDFEKISSWLKLCFSSKRKTILNNLSSVYKKEDIIKKLELMGINVNIRSEALSKEQLINIYDKFKD